MEPIENPFDTVFWLKNMTDGVLATPRPFATRAKARAYAAAFRRRYEAQGYYLTADGLRISPKDIELVVDPPDLFV